MAKTPTKKTATKTATKTAAKAAVKKPVKKGAKKVAEKPVKKAVKKPAKRPVKKVAKKVAKKAVKKPAKKVAEKVAEKVAKRPVKRAAEKPVKKPVKKGAAGRSAKHSGGADRWAKIRTLLGQRRAELVEEARRTIDDSLAQEKELMAEIGDRASEEIDDTFQARLQGREAKLIAKIDETLARIARGEYGLCESCGEEISYERLLARPVATLCIDCKTAQERQEKNYRR